MTKAKAPPTLANPAAREKLELAATAAGLSIQELADLVFDAGVIPPKAADGVVERYTMKELGERLWGTMQVVPRPERAEWFAALVPVQQSSMIVVLRDQGFRTEVISKELGLDPSEVLRTWNLYASKIGSQVVGLRLDSIAGSLQMASERAQEMALEDGNAATYWRIEREKIELLQTLGIVDRAAQKIDHVHKIDDAQKAELEALFALRQKQEKRKLEVVELKQIEEKGDAMPAEVEQDYDKDEEDDNE